MRKPGYDRRARVFYACGVDWQHEVGETGTRLYTSAKALKVGAPCWNQCGIVRLVIMPRWIKRQDLAKRGKVSKG